MHVALLVVQKAYESQGFLHDDDAVTDEVLGRSWMQPDGLRLKDDVVTLVDTLALVFAVAASADQIGPFASNADQVAIAVPIASSAAVDRLDSLLIKVLRSP